ncbi:glycoside hydrolase [Peribacillus butanolivorans]|uniref:glycoside hydrolase n=1 Tax=Peribacillus butanolivorans TaxID=421767 RepID=UPI0036C6A475
MYNTPPLIHLDAAAWIKRKQDIVQNMKTWQPFHKAALKQPMTNFEVLTSNRLVQRTTFGKHLSVIVNFGSKTYKGIKPHTAVILQDGKKTVIETKGLD